ncbi:hypothetical protein [Duganella sp. P38]|uniref:hypothetical protein n=1 Tax=Duganella sp. P38 TaxID=3423949 RepID=UPI003D7A0A7E
MSMTAKHLLTAAATAAFAIAATATTVTNAFAQTAPGVVVAEKKLTSRPAKPAPKCRPSTCKRAKTAR